MPMLALSYSHVAMFLVAQGTPQSRALVCDLRDRGNLPVLFDYYSVRNKAMEILLLLPLRLCAPASGVERHVQ